MKKQESPNYSATTKGQIASETLKVLAHAKELETLGLWLDEATEETSDESENNKAISLCISELVAKVEEQAGKLAHLINI